MNWGNSSFVTSTPFNKNSRASNKFIDTHGSIPSPIKSETDSRSNLLLSNFKNRGNVFGSSNTEKKSSPLDSIKENIFVDNRVDETILISDDEDSVVEIPHASSKVLVNDDVVQSLGEKFRKSLGGMGGGRTSASSKVNAPYNEEAASKPKEVPQDKYRSVFMNLKNQPVTEHKIPLNNKITNPISKGMNGDRPNKFSIGNFLNNDEDKRKGQFDGDTRKAILKSISDATKGLKRRSPPPTFDTPDRPKEEKPMAAFRKMIKRPGPMLCSPQPLSEKPVKEVLQDKKDFKDLASNYYLPPHLQKGRKTEDDMVTEIKRSGFVIDLVDAMTVDSIITTSKAKRLIGGLMNEDRMNTITEKLASLFKTLIRFSETFDSRTKVETPDNFVMQLNTYQKKGLAFLVEREKSYPSGGILADDMGLGKTAQMISLLVYQKNKSKDYKQLNFLKDRKAKENGLIPIKTTLIVAPLSLMSQWESEIRKFTGHSFLSVYQFHGPKRTDNVGVLGSYDVVISSYNTIASEFSHTVENEEDEDGKKPKKDKPLKKPSTRRASKTSVLEKVCFQRVILDEAHTIKNRNSKVSRACCALSALHRWCVTGTPIHNEMMDAFSLYRFLRCYPIDQEAMWKQYMSSGSAEGPFRLKSLVRATLLRRTKDETSEETGEKLVKLPKRHIEQVELEMTPAERLIYDQMFSAAQKFVKSFLDELNSAKSDMNILSNHISESKNPFLNGNMNDSDDNFKKMACILVYLLRLRQACNHFYLTKDGLDLNCFDAVDEKTAAIMKADKDLSQSMDESLMMDAGIDDHLDVFKSDFKSSKIKALFKRLDKVFMETNDKIIIISQWTSMFNLIQQHLMARDISYVAITGEVSQEDRQSAQSAINSANSGIRVMFLSLKAGGVGLNLIGANHIFMLDLHWNPFNEDQACDRIYRIGQTKEVFIHKFVCKNTVEKRVMELQDKKRELSKEFLGETKTKKANRLDNQDLAFIFDV
uniref:Transcription termination factor 2 (inferred by orthology to a human protein) n=1 Tax=Strongyloides venezuelensis TaxID=75913 RepID=A0A0K0F5U3_STRVS